MATRSTFSPTGLNIGRGNRNLTYLYGLSDFWTYLFEDSDKIELLLEATSQKISDVYSKFLQLTSTISIADIEVASHQQLKLVLIKDSDAVAGKVNTYALSDVILESRLIANRPFLPTAYLEDEIHYRISDDGTEIQFFEPLSSIGFATRLDSDGAKQYAMWFVDAIIDEAFLYEYFGKLIDAPAATSTENYKNFLYSLYYLYSNGPNLALFKKGLNLALGIPLAREAETVIDIRKYPDTDEYIVTTDMNSYLIPFGIPPSVAVGEDLEAFQEIAEWVEVKDWINDGDWWINLAIPPSLMPYLPPGAPDRFATSGSYADYLMRNFLKTHTFLVNVKTTTFKNVQNFEQLSDIINRAKPSYTMPIYVWTMPLPDEELGLVDDDLELRWDQFRCENINVPIRKFVRDFSLGTPLTRGCAQFTRDTVSWHTSGQIGNQSQINARPLAYEGGIVAGYMNADHQLRDNTTKEQAWIQTFHNRDSYAFRKPRTTMVFARDIPDDVGVSVNTFVPESDLQRTVFLYTTTQADIEDKYSQISLTAPGLSTWTWTLFGDYKSEGPINSQALNSPLIPRTNALLDNTNFNIFFFRYGYHYLGNFMPKMGYQTYSISFSDLVSGDYLKFIRVYEGIVGVYWVTNNGTIDVPASRVAEDTDALDIVSNDSPLKYGLGYYSSYYLLRGAGGSIALGTKGSINSKAVNDSPAVGGSLLPVGGAITRTYSDDMNPTPVNIDRSGVILKFRRDFK